VASGDRVLCRIESRGKRWVRWDARLGLDREWQEGIAFYWVDDGDDGDGVAEEGSPLAGQG
jgi:hypothetical protein